MTNHPHIVEGQIFLGGVDAVAGQMFRIFPRIDRARDSAAERHTLFQAMAETIAHLNHLTHAGQVVRCRDSAGQWVFR